jgi:excisionase family DNA binding protein
VGQVKTYKPPNQETVLEAMKRADKRAYLTCKEAAELSSISEIRIRRLIDAGDLPSMLDGRSRRVLTAAVYDRLIAKAKAANPVTGPKPKANPFWGVRPNGTRGVVR